MDGLQHVAAAAAEVVIDGQTYQLSPLTVGAFSEVERHVVSLRSNLLEELAAVIDRFNPDQQRQLLCEAVRETARQSTNASQEEVDAFLNTFDGACFFFWLSVRKKQPQVDSLQSAREILGSLNPAELCDLQRRLVHVSGLEALGNSRGQTQRAASDPPASRGRGSIAS